MDDLRRAEVAVAGGVLSKPKLINTLIEKVDLDSFSHPLDSILWAVLHIVSGESSKFKRVTIASIHEVLKHKRKGITRETIGGYANTIVSDEEFDDSLTIVADASVRKSIRDGIKIIDATIDTGESISDVLATIDTLRRVSSENLNRILPAETLSTKIDNVKARIDTVKNSYNKLTGISSGYDRFDRFTGGFQPEFIIIAARPSMGKTAFALQLSLNNALYYSRRPGFFSYEMETEALLMRLITGEANVSFQDFKRGLINQSQYERLMMMAEKFKGVDMYIDDNVYPLDVLASKIETAKEEHGIDFAVIDYLQLIPMPNSYKSRSRQEDVSVISSTLKLLSKRLQIPVIALAQLSRAAARKGGKAPALDELRESGSIEQDADVVAFIHRPYYYGIKEVGGRSMRRVAEIIFAKQRNGPTGIAELVWDDDNGRFANPAKKWIHVADGFGDD